MALGEHEFSALPTAAGGRPEVAPGEAIEDVDYVADPQAVISGGASPRESSAEPSQGASAVETSQGDSQGASTAATSQTTNAASQSADPGESSATGAASGRAPPTPSIAEQMRNLRLPLRNPERVANAAREKPSLCFSARTADLPPHRIRHR